MNFPFSLKEVSTKLKEGKCPGAGLMRNTHSPTPLADQN